MKLQHMLTLAACVSLAGSPFTKTFAADATPTPAPAPAATAKPAKPVDPDKEKWDAARKKAMEDPDVKAAMENAQKVQMDATKKMLEKIREIDPSLAPVVDKQEERMKPREPKPPKAPKEKPAKPDAKKSATPAAIPAASPTAAKTDDTKPADKSTGQ